MATKPFKYQLEDVRRLHRMGGRQLVANEMGTGKTLTALLYAVRHPAARPAVVVCPASLKWNWEHEALHHVGMRAEVLGGTRPPAGGVRARHQLLIINYDVLPFWLGHLAALRPQLVVLDECHFLAGRRTRRTRACRELCRGVPHVLALSGTPLVNKPAELWSTLNILDPRRFPYFTPFAQRYCAPRKRPWGWTYEGATHLDELHGLLSTHLMIRRRKADVLQDLPAKTRGVVPLDVVKRAEYVKAETAFLAWLRGAGPGKALRASRAERLVQAGYLKRLAAQLKLPAVLGWVDDFLNASEGKLVLFAVHKKVVAALKERYKRECVVVDGSVTGRLRQLAVEQFQKLPRVRLFVGNIRAAGVGLNLTAASTLAFCELDWTPGAHVQAEDRIHRIGQKNAANVYYLVARGTIEERLCALIQRKQKVLAATLDGGKRPGDLDVFDTLCRELARKREI